MVMKSNGCGSNICAQPGILVNGNMDEKLRSGGFISHDHKRKNLINSGFPPLPSPVGHFQSESDPGSTQPVSGGHM